jgi:hypothetical protein
MAVGFRTSTLLLAVASLVPIDAYAFTTVIDTPPAPAPSFLSANTQVNIHKGGYLLARSVGVPYSGTNIEINLVGGWLGDQFSVYQGATINMSSGAIGSGLSMYSGSAANISGGSLSDNFNIGSGSHMTLSGGEFMLNGQPIGGLGAPGQSLPLDVPDNAVLSGTLSDGTPFAYGSSYGDRFDPGTLTLKTTVVPSIGLTDIVTSRDPIPNGLRQGQTLTLDSKVDLPRGFTAISGSTLNIVDGGQYGGDVKVVGGKVNVSGGYSYITVGALSGTVMNIDNGVIGGFRAEAGGVVHMSGGETELVAGAKEAHSICQVGCWATRSSWSMAWPMFLETHSHSKRKLMKEEN